MYLRLSLSFVMLCLFILDTPCPWLPPRILLVFSLFTLATLNLSSFIFYFLFRVWTLNLSNNLVQKFLVLNSSLKHLRVLYDHSCTPSLCPVPFPSSARSSVIIFGVGIGLESPRDVGPNAILKRRELYSFDRKQ